MQVYLELRNVSDQAVVESELLHLWNAFNAESLSPVALCERLQKTHSSIIVSYANGCMAGFICYGPYNTPLHHEASVEIWGLFVRPTCRCHGIGTALVRKALETMSSRRFFVTTTATSAGLYARCGFAKVQGSRYVSRTNF